MVARSADISKAFGVIQRGFSAGLVPADLRQELNHGWEFGQKIVRYQMRTGFPANSVFIVDSKDRVRYHTVLDPRFEKKDGVHGD